MRMRKVCVYVDTCTCTYIHKYNTCISMVTVYICVYTSQIYCIHVALAVLVLKLKMRIAFTIYIHPCRMLCHSSNINFVRDQYYTWHNYRVPTILYCSIMIQPTHCGTYIHVHTCIYHNRYCFFRWILLLST